MPDRVAEKRGRPLAWHPRITLAQRSRLRLEATSRGLSEDELVSELIRAICDDDLFKALLD